MHYKTELQQCIRRGNLNWVNPSIVESLQVRNYCLRCCFNKTPISSVNININVQINAFVYFHIITITILNPNNLMCQVRGFADDHVH